LNCPCHAVGQFFHSQCIQSKEANIPGNPRSAFSFKRRSTSSWVGARR
jgi:hypothetical protein